jgi:hypothetical protein
MRAGYGKGRKVRSFFAFRASYLLAGHGKIAFRIPGPDPLPPLATRLSYCPPQRFGVTGSSLVGALSTPPKGGSIDFAHASA